MDHLDFEFSSRQTVLMEEDVRKQLSDSFILDYKNLQSNCYVDRNRSLTYDEGRAPRKYSRVRSNYVIMSTLEYSLNSRRLSPASFLITPYDRINPGILPNRRHSDGALPSAGLGDG